MEGSLKAEATGPLSGIRVFDFSRVIAGPYATTMMSQMGAEVIRVEQPGGGEDRFIGMMTDDGARVSTAAVVSHSKKGITLDLKSGEAGLLLGKMAAAADVFVHNFTPGTQQAALFEEARYKEINPRLVIAAISGFGQYGPYSKRPCFDNVAQAMSGMMSYNGFPGSSPLKSAVPLVDFGAALHLSLGIVSALYERQKSGKGQSVDVSLFDTAVSYVAQSSVAAEYSSMGVERKPFGNCGTHAYSVCSRTKDGWVYINPLGVRIWERFIVAIGQEELRGDPRFFDDNSRLANRESLDQVVNAWTGARETAAVVRTLEKARVPCGPVNGISDLYKDPQIKAREMLVTVDYPGLPGLTVANLPIKFSRTRSGTKGPAPLIGQHNDGIYGELFGLSGKDIERLKKEKAI